MRLSLQFATGGSFSIPIEWYKIHEGGTLEFYTSPDSGVMTDNGPWNVLAPEQWLSCTIEHWGYEFTFQSPACSRKS